MSYSWERFPPLAEIWLERNFLVFSLSVQTMPFGQWEIPLKQSTGSRCNRFQSALASRVN